MNTLTNKANIVLSGKRMKRIRKTLRVGDYLSITVKKNLGEGRYIIRLHEMELVALFNGIFPTQQQVFAVVQTLEPNILLKLISREGNIPERVATLRGAIDSIAGPVSLQPLCGEMIQSVLVLIQSAQSWSASSQEGRKLRSSIDMIEKIMRKQVLYLEEPLAGVSNVGAIMDSVRTFGQDLVCAQSVLTDCLEQQWLRDKQEMYNTILTLKQECDDMLVRSTLEADINSQITMQKKYRYVQLPIYMQSTLGTMELFIPEAGCRQGSGQVWIQHNGLTFIGIEIERLTRTITTERLMYSLNDPRHTEAIFACLKERLKEIGWRVRGEVALLGLDCRKVPFPARPVGVSVKMLQHFTIVV